MNYELEIDLNTSYIPTKEEIIGMIDGGSDAVDNEPRGGHYWNFRNHVR